MGKRGASTQQTQQIIKDRNPKTKCHIKKTTRKKNCTPKSDYELFNCNNFSIRYWSWKPRLLAPDLPSNWFSISSLSCSHSNCITEICNALVFIVTTSLCQDWVICAPAAFLGSGSRLSGSLSGIEPNVPRHP